MPDQASLVVIDAFLAICVHMISLNRGEYSNKSLKILFYYLKSDPKVFGRFKVTRPIVRKMKLIDYVFSKIA